MLIMRPRETVALVAVFLIACAILLLGCSDSSKPYTFGDSYYDVAGAWCYRSNVCGYNDDIPVCWEHAYFHGCKVDHSCDDVLPDAAIAETEACVEALLVWDCGPALWDGALPEECDAIRNRWSDR